MTRLPLAALISSLALIGAACGGSDTADAPATTAPASAAPTTATAPTTAAAAAGDSVDLITAEVVRQASESGVVIDSACAADVVRKLSDADQQLLVDSIGDDTSDPTLSAEGEVLSAELLGCADKDRLIDLMMTSMESMPGVDADCVRALFEQMDPQQILTLGDDSSAEATEFSAQLMTCMKGS